MNTSIPALGLSTRTKVGSAAHSRGLTPDSPYDERINAPGVLSGEIKSADAALLTSTNLIELKETLSEVYADRIDLKKEILLTKDKIRSSRNMHIFFCFLIIGLFVKAFRKRWEVQKEYLSDIEAQLENSFVNIDIHFDQVFQDQYDKLVESYKRLLASKRIWDITSTVRQDAIAERSAASSVVTRTDVRFKFDHIDIIKSTYPAFHFENRNGGDLFIYPAFVIMRTNQSFALIDMNDFTIDFSAQRFLEQNQVPSDTKTVGSTWAKVNKNGTPDKRFKGNYEIPIVEYGNFSIKSTAGLNESYCFSNYETSKSFVKAFSEYQEALS